MKRKNIKFILLIILSIVWMCTSFYIDDEQTLGETDFSEASYPLAVHFIDVGQADCVYIKLPDDKTMLIDAGDNDDGKIIESYLEKKGVEKIDYLVGTHPHADHIGGMDYVVNRFEIGNVYMPKVSANSASFEDVLLALKKKDKKIITAKEGVVIFEGDNIKAEILSPEDKKYDEINNYSAVVKLAFGKSDFLFMGDAEKEIEHRLIENSDIDCDVLKVPHHGSNTSSTEDFVKKSSPEYGVISVGKDNDYGHPKDKVLKTYDKYGTEIYRTDRDGTVIFLSDGNNIDVITEK